MSKLGDALTTTLKAAGDLSAAQFKVMKISGVNTVTTNDSATGKVIGILLDKPAAAGEGAEIAYFGPTKAIIGSGGCTAGDLLGPDASGTLVVKTTDKDQVIAKALVTAVAGDVADVLLTGVAWLGA